MLTSDDAEPRIREDTTNGIHVAPLTRVRVQAVEDVATALRAGDSRRQTAQTDFNAHSSRSHAVLVVVITMHSRTTCLNLIDLAGSERAATSSERRKEGAFINKS